MNPINEQSLRWQLQALRQDVPPPEDLWPGIEARIAAAPAHARSPQDVRHVHARRLAPWAVAASLLLAVGFLHQLEPGTGHQPVPGNPLIRQQAVSMALDYEKALAHLQQSGTRGDVQAALEELDRSAAQILIAIEHDPESRFLLEQLRRTYNSRLQLTQRAALT
ncbi:MAG: hypothetical protein LH491_08380 [Pseudoxanthomonas sp.]|nr:hypothetical protein [Pseudoxanthomonas sp.]